MRYIDADALIEDIQETVCTKCGDIYDGIKCKSCGIDDTLDFLENAPTADVVPKREVVNILDELMKEIREIAERYEKSANETSDYDYARIEYRGCQMGALLAVFKIAELKKKYTGEKECPKCKHFVGCEKANWARGCEEYKEEQK